MASDDTHSSQVVARGKPLEKEACKYELKYHKLLDEAVNRDTLLGHRFRTCFRKMLKDGRSLRHEEQNKNAGYLSSDQKMWEKREAAFGASLAKLKKLDGFEARLEEVVKMKMMQRENFSNFGKTKEATFMDT